MPSACSPFRKAPHHPIYLPYSPTQSTGFGFSLCRTGIIPSTDAHRAHYLWRLDKDWLNQRLIDCPIRPIFRRRAKPNPNETHRDNKRKAPFLMCKAEHKKSKLPHLQLYTTAWYRYDPNAREFFGSAEQSSNLLTSCI